MARYQRGIVSGGVRIAVSFYSIQPFKFSAHSYVQDPFYRYFRLYVSPVAIVKSLEYTSVGVSNFLSFHVVTLFVFQDLYAMGRRLGVVKEKKEKKGS